MTAIDYSNLSPECAHLDQALYVASVLCAASVDGKAYIYCTTQRGVVTDPSGEKYLVFRGDENARFHLRDDQGWHFCYAISKSDA